MALKIALYYPYVYLRSGVERTILEIMKKSRHEWTVFTNRFEEETTYPELINYRERIKELTRISTERSYLQTLRSAFIISCQKLPLHGFDALWVHNEGLGSIINFRNSRIPRICFCHTPMKLVYDEISRNDYLAKNRGKALGFSIFSFLFRVVDRVIFNRYDACFCVSEEVKRRIVKNKLFRKQELRVIYRGVDTRTFDGQVEYRDYFFHPARFKWWKNIELSILAFNAFQKKHEGFSGFKLVIAGEVYPTNVGYYKTLVELASGNKNIVFITNPSHEQLLRLYRSCRAVLSTTLNEDFGLTILEGFSFSKPVLAVDQGGPKEIIRDGQTGLLSPAETGEYAVRLARLAENRDLAVAMGTQARKASLTYDWDNFIQYIDSYLEELVSRSKPR